MRVLLMCLLLAASAAAQAEIKTQELHYKDLNGTPLVGYFAYDDAIQGPRPGVVVVHEWWGLNDYAKGRARALAALGYSALAIDMYGEGKNTEHPKDAMAFMQEASANAAVSSARFDAGVQLLKQQPQTNPAKVAAIGYCFGGTVVLNAARHGETLAGVVSFHGGLAAKTRATKGSVKTPILVEHGELDSMSTPKDVADFKTEMSTAGVNYQFVVQPGAKHGFTNPDADRLAHGDHGGPDIGYNKEADEKSWADMQAFLKKVFS